MMTAYMAAAHHAPKDRCETQQGASSLSWTRSWSKGKKGNFSGVGFNAGV